MLGVAAGLVLLPLCLAELPAPGAKDHPPATATRRGGLSLPFLPTALQRNPHVNQTVITEMTGEGRTRPPPTPAQPVYYVAHSNGPQEMGHGPSSRTAQLQEEMAGLLVRSLAVNNYQPADAAHPPSLLVVYAWGSHTRLDPGSEEIEGTGSLDVRNANLLTRASLVGGAKFAKELAEVLVREENYQLSLYLAPAAFQSMMRTYTPLNLFTQFNPRNRTLYEQAQSDCYFVVASAYDYAAAARKERVLLWRTKMTVDSQGVAMKDALPAVLASAGKYLGVDMSDAATFSGRLAPEGRVEIGPTEVREYRELPFKEEAAAPPPDGTPRRK